MPAPLPPFTVLFVAGVTPGKWARVWNERMRRQRLELRPATTAEALAALRDGSAGAAFLRDVPADDEFSAIRLYEEAPVVVAARDHLFSALGTGESVGPEELAGENVLEGQDAAAVELVAAGVGVARMPQSVARALSRRDVIARPLRDTAPTTISLVWPIDRTTPEVQAFIGIVRGRTENSSRG
ncbi:LysR family transcriptional regulator substrate-binding protein [Lysinimonas soli]|uniref:LysR family transcriptional regulator substrate-binding protein n=1 Tax=Lysinimonas soli TaxID=1074233 RepID=A0ABW0NMM0_9MICO